MNQSKKDVPSINQNPIHIAPDPFLVGMFGLSVRLVSLFPELSLFAVYFPPLSFYAKPKAKSQNPFSNKLPSPSKRVGTVADVG